VFRIRSAARSAFATQAHLTTHRQAQTVGMKTTEFWYWRMRSETTGKLIKSVCRYTEEDALKRDPQAVRIEGSCVLVDVAETAEEIAARAPRTPASGMPRP
jgi:hypothetical protein